MKAFDGEPIDKVEQLTHIRFTGRELKEFCDHVEQQVKKFDLADVVEPLPILVADGHTQDCVCQECKLLQRLFPS